MQAPRRWRLFAVLLIVTSFASLYLNRPRVIHAAAGDLDPTFGSNGLGALTYGGAYAAPHDVVVQPDGKIVVAGTAQMLGIGIVSTLGRLLPTGSPDTSFGSNGSGSVTTIWSDPQALGFAVDAMALSPNGTIVVAGTSGNTVPCSTSPCPNPYEVGLARYTASGSIDASFGQLGKDVLETSKITAIIALKVQTDGKIIAVGGVSQYYGPGRAAVVRVNADGSIDSTFSEVVALGSCAPFAVALRPNGKILVTAGCSDGSIDVLQLNSDGSPDTTFGVGGIATGRYVGDSNPTSATPYSIGVAVDGSVFIAVSVGFTAFCTTCPPSYVIEIIKFTSNGTMDPMFHISQAVFQPISYSLGAMSVESNGKILLTGLLSNYNPYRIYMAQLNSDGSSDTTVTLPTIPIPPGTNLSDPFNVYSRRLAIGSDGKLVVALSIPSTPSALTPSAGAFDIVVARYLTPAMPSVPMATQLAFTQQPTSAVVGQPFIAKVALEDASNNPVATSGVPVTLSATGRTGTLTCTANPQATDAAGVATFSCSLGQAGSYILHAASTGLTPADGTAFTVVVPTKAIVLIQGVNTKLRITPAGQARDGTFFGGDKLGSFLQTQLPTQSGWNNAAFLEYSYSTTHAAGGQVDSQGAWVPDAYACQDTFTQHIEDDVLRLDAMLQAYARAHLGTEFYLVGHSQGGLLAFAYLAYFARGPLSWNWLPNGATVQSVVTVDSPLGGLPTAIGVPILAAGYRIACSGMDIPAGLPPQFPPFLDFDDFQAIWATDGADPRGASASVGHAIFGFSPTSNETLATTAASHGITVLTVGNTRDWLYAPCSVQIAPMFTSQWLSDNGTGSGVYARGISDGSKCNPTEIVTTANHGAALRDLNVEQAIFDLFTNPTQPLPVITTGAKQFFVPVVPGPVTPVSPANDATNQSLTPVLAWQAPTGSVAGQTRYTVNLLDQATAGLVATAHTTNLSVHVPRTAGLQSGHQYAWQVIACNADDLCNDTGPIYSFTTKVAP